MRIDVRDIAYMIMDNQKKYLKPEIYETKDLAKIVMELTYSSYWIGNGYVEIITVPIKFLNDDKLE